MHSITQWDQIPINKSIFETKKFNTSKFRCDKNENKGSNIFWKLVILFGRLIKLILLHIFIGHFLSYMASKKKSMQIIHTNRKQSCLFEL